MTDEIGKTENSFPIYENNDQNNDNINNMNNSNINNKSNSAVNRNNLSRDILPKINEDIRVRSPNNHFKKYFYFNQILYKNCSFKYNIKSLY